MMHIKIFIAIFLTTTSWSVSNNTGKSNSYISKIIFSHYISTSTEGEKSINTLQDSIKNKAQTQNRKTNALTNISMVETYGAMPQKEIHIDIVEDTIWRYETVNGEKTEILWKIDKENGILYRYWNHNTSLLLSQFNYFEAGGIYSIEKFPDDQKEILGYRCYKVVIVKEERIDKDFPIRLGDSIFEMYVTDKIDLPIHALFDYTKHFPGIFPLEVRIWHENTSGSQEVFEVKELITE